jgi:hypothetical protein
MGVIGFAAAQSLFVGLFHWDNYRDIRQDHWHTLSSASLRRWVISGYKQYASRKCPLVFLLNVSVIIVDSNCIDNINTIKLHCYTAVPKCSATSKSNPDKATYFFCVPSTFNLCTPKSANILAPVPVIRQSTSTTCVAAQPLSS